MDKITQVTGIAVPLPRSNVDTDQIIPAVFLKRVTKTGFDDALFHEWRKDPEFVLNDPTYVGAGPTEVKVLFAGPDFGTGSSREHAVWASARFRVSRRSSRPASATSFGETQESRAYSQEP